MNDADPPADIIGQSVEEASATLAARTDAAEDEIATALEAVSEAGQVTKSAIDDAVADASMTLSTAENRVEYAAVEVESASGTVADATEYAVVQARLDALEKEVKLIESERDDLQRELQSAVERRSDPAELYAVVRELQRIERAAERLQGRADELIAEASDLERFVEDPALVVPTVESDLDAYETYLDDAASTVENIAAVVEGDRETEGDPAAVWFETVVRHRFKRLVVADLRLELETLAELGGEVGDLQRRLDGLEERWEATDESLDGVARRGWVETYGDRIEDAGAAADGFEAPVDWAAVQTRLEDVLSGRQ